MAEPLVLKDHSGESQVYFDRAVLGFGVLIILTLFLVARLFYLQVMQHDVYATISENNRIQVQPLPPVRGLIFDTNGELIADNRPVYNLTITTELVDDLDQTIAQLRNTIELSDSEIASFERRLKRKQRPFESVAVKYRLSQEERARVSVDSHAMPGVNVEAKLVRSYPKGELLAHAVGSVRRINEEDARSLDPVAYSGTDHIGKIGIERFYEDDLLGKVGYQRVETNARGRIMNQLDVTPPVPGNNLTLFLDASLQAAASDALGDRRGSIVAIDPKTGGILAMVSKPGYDPNLFVTGIPHSVYAELRDSLDVPLFNRALQGQYEPGSTIKPLIGLAGLASGITNPETTIEDPGWYRLPNDDRLYRDWNWTKTGLGGHGDVNLDKAIYRSCNIYFYDLAVKMGIDRLEANLRQFGFGQQTALDLPEARSGLLPSRDWKMSARGLHWYPGDTVNIGIGQGDMLVTPLQLATAVTVLANRGRFVSPRMLKSGSNLYEASTAVKMPDVTGVSEHQWKLVTSAMEKVVHRGNQVYGENGTAWAYIGQDIPYRMAGKSGTAQVVGIGQGEIYDEELLNERQRKHAWFVAFAPVEDPVIALAVLVENGGGGSSVAAPVARAVLDHYLVNQGAMSVAVNTVAVNTVALNSVAVNTVAVNTAAVETVAVNSVALNTAVKTAPANTPTANPDSAETPVIKPVTKLPASISKKAIMAGGSQ